MRGEDILVPGSVLPPGRHWSRVVRHRRWLALLAGWGLAALGATVAFPAQAGDFTVRNAHTALDRQIYRLDADLGYHLSEAALEALSNGVTLTLVLDIEVYQPRRYLWDEVVASLEQRNQIRYHALSDQYILRNLNSGSQYAYSSLEMALRAMGRISALPVIDAPLLADGASYKVRVRSRLDIDSLPVPLRLKAYVSSEWWMDSGWYAWDL